MDECARMREKVCSVVLGGGEVDNDCQTHWCRWLES